MDGATFWMFAQIAGGVAVAVCAPKLLDLPTRHRIGPWCDCAECNVSRRWAIAGVIVIEAVAIGAVAVGVTYLIRIAGGE